MNFLGCEGMWQVNADGTPVCTGELQTFTAQEMRDLVSPELTTEQRAEITGALVALFVFVWVCRTVRNSI